MPKLVDSELRYRRLFESAQDGILILDAQTGMIEDVNPYLIKMLGYSREEFIQKKLWEVGAFKDIESSKDAFEVLQTNEYIRYEDLPLKSKDGQLIQVEFVSNVYLVNNEKVIQCNIRDITERKQTEKALQKSEARYRRLFESAQDGILILDAQTGMIDDVNPFLIKMLGYSREEFLKKKLWEVGAFRDVESSKDAFEALQVNEYIRYEDLPLKTKDGRLIQVEFVSNVYLVSEEKVIQCNIRDITERKREEEMRTRLAAIIESSDDAIFSKTLEGLITSWNRGAQNLYGYSAEEVIGQPVSILIPLDQPYELEKILMLLKQGERVEHFEAVRLRKDGEKLDVSITISSIKGAADRVVGYSVITRDITARKLAEAKIRRQFEHLKALSSIDRIIARNFDLQISLSEILIHVTTELGMDAADILLLNPTSQVLQFGAERGFRTEAARTMNVRLGESFAGRAALRRQLVQISDLRHAPENVFLTTLLQSEGFFCYFGVPLIIKGQVKGVLEVFHRSVFQPDSEWFDFLNTLAGQIAIAIENATLFEDQQHSTQELKLAYDATIEGWSRALDLRDKETEGHSQRVTTMAVNLARSFGLSEADLVQVRWGSLLHDIGKMGVPDQILLKPGTLTDEEWVAMKKHSTFAYEMLSPIHYLRMALDIPYCHHEKWDGSGYPRGLKGAQIPLTARIFAVVDVWDALTSNRPYRAAWDAERAREYIRTSSGTHFDPQVVNVFMQATN